MTAAGVRTIESSTATLGAAIHAGPPGAGRAAAGPAEETGGAARPRADFAGALLASIDRETQAALAGSSGAGKPAPAAKRDADKQERTKQAANPGPIAAAGLIAVPAPGPVAAAQMEAPTGGPVARSLAAGSPAGLTLPGPANAWGSKATRPIEADRSGFAPAGEAGEEASPDGRSVGALAGTTPQPVAAPFLLAAVRTGDGSGISVPASRDGGAPVDRSDDGHGLDAGIAPSALAPSALVPSALVRSGPGPAAAVPGENRNSAPVALSGANSDMNPDANPGANTGAISGANSGANPPSSSAPAAASAWPAGGEADRLAGGRAGLSPDALARGPDSGSGGGTLAPEEGEIAASPVGAAGPAAPSGLEAGSAGKIVTTGQAPGTGSVVRPSDRSVESALAADPGQSRLNSAAGPAPSPALSASTPEAGPGTGLDPSHGLSPDSSLGLSLSPSLGPSSGGAPLAGSAKSGLGLAPAAAGLRKTAPAGTGHPGRDAVLPAGTPAGSLVEPRGGAGYAPGEAMRSDPGEPGSRGLPDALARMGGAGETAPAGPSLHGNGAARAVEVGINDPAHGWIEVRAQGTAGLVSASLRAASPEAHAALDAQLPAMTQYLAERQLGVHAIDVRSSGAGSGPPGQGALGGDAGADAGGQAGDSGHGQAREGARAASQPARTGPAAPTELSAPAAGLSWARADADGRLINVRV